MTNCDYIFTINIDFCVKFVIEDITKIFLFVSLKFLFI